jgi:hypothetical protein
MTTVVRWAARPIPAHACSLSFVKILFRSRPLCRKLPQNQFGLQAQTREASKRKRLRSPVGAMAEALAIRARKRTHSSRRNPFCALNHFLLPIEIRHTIVRGENRARQSSALAREQSLLPRGTL